MENNPSLNQDLPHELRQDLITLGFYLQGDEPLWTNDFVNKTYLKWESGSLTLYTPSQKKLNINFSSRAYSRKIAPASDLLCRACGWHLGLRQVWDLTAGMGVDAVTLSRAGFQVNAFERNPFLAVLLRQALREQQNEEGLVDKNNLGQINFICGDAENKLIEMAKLGNQKNIPEVIYYDPMYPPSKKSALPSKEIQILRELNGVNEESKSLLEKALDLGVRRVVVKRPHRAPPVLPHPQAQIEGKLLRFDIYS